MNSYNDRSAESVLGEIEYSCQIMLSQGSSEEEVRKLIRDKTIELIDTIEDETFKFGVEYATEEFRCNCEDRDDEISDLESNLSYCKNKIDSLEEQLISRDCQLVNSNSDIRSLLNHIKKLESLLDEKEKPPIPKLIHLSFSRI